MGQAEDDKLVEAAIQNDVAAAQAALDAGASVNAAHSGEGANWMLRGCPALVAAVGRSVAVLKLLVERGAPKDLKDDEGETLVHQAVKDGNEEAVRYLLHDLKLDANAAGTGRWNEGETPLHLAMPRASTPGMTAIVGMLIDAGADVNAVCGSDIKSVLHFAADTDAAELIKILLAHGANADALDDNGFGPLAAAAMNDKQAAMAVLLENASQQAKDQALLATASRQATDSIKALIAAGAKATGKHAKTRLTALHFNMANYEVNTEITRMLIDADADVNAKDEEGATPLCMATGSIEAVKMLLAAGADVKAAKESGETALHCACQNSNSGAPVVQLLLDAGAASVVNAAGRWGFTPLMNAARRSDDGAAEVVKLLLARGANVNAKDEDGATPLSMATGSIEAVKMLLAAGADATVAESSGDTALHSACQSSDGAPVVQLLLDAGAASVVNAVGRSGLTPLMNAARRNDGAAEVIKLLLAAGADVNVKDEEGATPLCMATGSIEAVKMLLAAGADVKAAKDSGDTALHNACQNSDSGAPVVQLLLDAGAASVVNAAGQSGLTPLMNAARRYDDGAGELVKLLLARGADKSTKDADGQTAAEMAQDEAVKALLQ